MLECRVVLAEWNDLFNKIFFGDLKVSLRYSMERGKRHGLLGQGRRNFPLM